jgi:tetratricopeptide (TPR) repeat protein
MGISKEDYIEPRCVLCEEPYGKQPEIKPVPQRRIIEKLDEYMSHRDYAGAERHLLYWLEEAKLGGDLKGELMIRSELVGHYRKVLNRERAFENADAALELIGRIGYEGSISEATVYVNIATVYNAFSENDRSIAMFEKARSIYESIPELRPELLGGLYNNMALTYVALKQFPKAYELYDKAMETMKKVENGELEQAISYLNIANAKEDELGLEEAGEDIESCLDKAYALLDTPSVPRGGYYAFVCEKCAPTFDYYGYFVAAEELKKRAKEIYERT